MYCNLEECKQSSASTSSLVNWCTAQKSSYEQKNASSHRNVLQVPSYLDRRMFRQNLPQDNQFIMLKKAQPKRVLMMINKLIWFPQTPVTYILEEYIDLLPLPYPSFSGPYQLNCRC